ncbi:MAG: hypothetical protein BGO27_04695 [Alphaproteobacteria bacterium 33-17]|nr:MAG: hypothetical protein BGO27_04695 [Alphaproteobacteria bacterium 33-17]
MFKVILLVFSVIYSASASSAIEANDSRFNDPRFKSAYQSMDGLIDLTDRTLKEMKQDVKKLEKKAEEAKKLRQNVNKFNAEDQKNYDKLLDSFVYMKRSIEDSKLVMKKIRYYEKKAREAESYEDLVGATSVIVNHHKKIKHYMTDFHIFMMGSQSYFKKLTDTSSF